MTNKDWNASIRGWSMSILLLLTGLAGTAGPTQAQETELSGLVFGDYYWLAAHHEETIEGRHGFWFRRIYVTLDHDFAQDWSVRVRGEMAQPGDFTSNAVMTPFAKDVYLAWSRGEHTVRLGLAPTPSFSLLEEWWGYRPVEKTPLDLYRFATSRDIGLSAVGHLGEELPVRYHAMVANGSGTGSEINAGKKAMLSLSATPLDRLTVEAYGDLENTTAGHYYTLQGALYVRLRSARLGLQYAHQSHRAEATPDQSFDVLSLFGRVPLGEALAGFARFDRQFQPHPAGQSVSYLPLASNANANLLLVGLDVSLTEQVHLMPNAEAVVYDSADGETPGATVLPRLTFYYTF